MTQAITDEQLLAYLDGQLNSDAEYTTVEATLHSDEKLRTRLQALVDSGERIRLAYQQKLQEPVPARLIESIWHAPVGLAQEQPHPTRSASPGQRQTLGARVRALWFPGHAVWGGVVAASLAWMALGLMVLPSLQGHAPSNATAQWAQAGTLLESERVLVALQALPSGQVVNVRGATLEVLGSFEGADGQHCRELQETRQVSGGIETHLALVCSAGDGLWAVAAAASSMNGLDAYQTASDAMHEAMDAALRQRNMGPALTPEQEDERIAAGWRKGDPTR